MEDSEGLFFDFFLVANICSYSSADSSSLFVGFRKRLLSAFPAKPYVYSEFVLLVNTFI